MGPLDGDARRRLIAQSLGADHASDALVREVSAVVGGNPLAMLEVVEALSERDRVRARAQLDGAGEIVADLVTDDRGEALLPGTLDEVLAARIDALPPTSRALLRWCALCEAELTRPLVDALGGPEGPRVRARLVTDGILVETTGASECVTVLAFAHAALRRLLRAAVDPTAMPAMHARLAEVLERQGVTRRPGWCGTRRRWRSTGRRPGRRGPRRARGWRPRWPSRGPGCAGSARRGRPTSGC